ncbi:pimeloyl-ACP methyl ester esterase BioH [Colwellia sp. 12G3]|uniref:pimeloyl-ACP methyl ester esterase BioH n=1 Tax=Colwellia sp. 12G3 TaxID=2058299 RepID=UPI000C34DB9B|nr:pimeloyl-ACP methyl ester esterase BioH [Colwellia sp. 12G3]PKI16465.1 pimeloyl-[acyl-carrier protein] methyl ester esterase [Colwellia sp. 12G3]
MAKSLKFSTFPPNNTLKKNIIPIVLIHGWGLNSGVWQPLLALFNENKESSYQIITLDLPGFGINSLCDIKPYSLTNICHHIDQVIDQPAIYLGWSLGGLIATEMSLKYPEKVLALITVASSPYFVEKSMENWPGIKANVLDNFHSQLAKDTAKTISGFLKIQAMGSPHIRQDLKLITQLVMELPLPGQKTLADSLALLSHCDLRLQLSSIKQPFLRLYGHNDSLVPKAVIEQISHLAPNGDLHLFEHASHAPFISHLDEFYQVLLTWLDSHFN